MTSQQFSSGDLVRVVGEFSQLARRGEVGRVVSVDRSGMVKVVFEDRAALDYFSGHLVAVRFDKFNDPTPDPVGAPGGEIGLLLEQGRQRLLEVRDNQAAAQVLEQKENEADWAALLSIAREHCHPLSGMVPPEMPDGFNETWKRRTFILEVAGIGWVARAFERVSPRCWKPVGRTRYSEASWAAVAFRPHPEALDTIIGGVRYTHVREEDDAYWHWVDCLEDALARAEEVSAGLASIEATGRRMVEIPSEARRRKPSPGERLLEALTEYLQHITEDRECS